jgi:hypothetical protein
VIENGPKCLPSGPVKLGTVSPTSTFIDMMAGGGELCLDTELRGAVEYEGVCRAVIVIDVIEDIEAWHRRDDARIDVAEALGIWARTELGGIGSVGQAY